MNLDQNQFGNRKGVSTAHYLVKLVDNLCFHAESTRSYSTLVITDFSKAFDHVDHNVLIQDLLRMGTRPSLIPWICNFLSERSQCVRYKNVLSDFHVLKGGLPQGTKFGPLGFLAKFNGAVDLETAVNKVLSLKYVDDMTLVENCLNNHPTNIQSVLDKFSEWAQQNHMNINLGKCCNMNVCFMKKNIPHFPTLRILDTELEMTDCVKILGVLVSADLKWDEHVDHIYHKANSKMFML